MKPIFILEKTMLRAGLVFFAAIVLMSLWTSVQAAESLPLAAGMLIGVGVVMAAALIAVNRYLPRKGFILLLLLGAFGVRAAWALSVDSEIVSDFKVMYMSAIQASHGDLSFGVGDYFTRWGYQLGFTLYEGLVITVFGESVIPLKLLNCLFQSATAVLVYVAAGRIFGEAGGRAAGVLYAVYVPNIVMCSVLSNQHLSIFLFALGSCIALSPRFKNGYYGAAAVALCFALGNLIRPMGSVFTCCFLVYVLLAEWREYGLDKKRLLPVLRKMVSYLAVYLVLLKVVNLILIGTGVTELPLGNREPYWKFMVGLNPDSNGAWSQADARYVEPYPVGEERDRASLALLKERLQDPVQVAGLFVRKWAIMWGAEDSSATWSLLGKDQEALKSWLIRIERSQYAWLAVFGFLTLAAVMRRSRSNSAADDPQDGRFALPDGPGWYLPFLLLSAYAAVHLVIEIQTRYRLDILPFFIILTGPGGAMAARLLSSRMRKKAAS